MIKVYNFETNNNEKIFFTSLFHDNNGQTIIKTWNKKNISNTIKHNKYYIIKDNEIFKELEVFKNRIQHELSFIQLINSKYIEIIKKYHILFGNKSMKIDENINVNNLYFSFDTINNKYKLYYLNNNKLFTYKINKGCSKIHDYEMIENGLISLKSEEFIVPLINSEYIVLKNHYFINKIEIDISDNKIIDLKNNKTYNIKNIENKIFKIDILGNIYFYEKEKIKTFFNGYITDVFEKIEKINVYKNNDEYERLYEQKINFINYFIDENYFDKIFDIENKKSALQNKELKYQNIDELIYKISSSISKERYNELINILKENNVNINEALGVEFRIKKLFNYMNYIEKKYDNLYDCIEIFKKIDDYNKLKETLKDKKNQEKILEHIKTTYKLGTRQNSQMLRNLIKLYYIENENLFKDIYFYEDTNEIDYSKNFIFIPTKDSYINNILEDKFIDFKQNKGKDCLVKIDNKFYVIEAKDIDESGGEQSKQFEDMEETTKIYFENEFGEKLIGVGLLDGAAVLDINKSYGKKAKTNKRIVFLVDFIFNFKNTIKNII